MKVAILGTENSHADAFAQLIRDDADFADITLVGAYGYDAQANQRLKDKGLVTRFADTPDAFVDEVDAVLVTARHGDHHYPYAKAYLEKGLHAFIDKPITITAQDANQLFALAERSGALVCGGSSLKFLRWLDDLIAFMQGKRILAGHVSAPISMVNDYAGFYFYAQHMVEMMFRVFGTDIRSVVAHCPDTSKNRVSAIFDYGEFDVAAHYYDGYEYTATVWTDKSWYRINTYELGDCYKQELMEFQTMVNTRTLPRSFEELKKPGTLMRLIEQSYTTGKLVEVVWE